MGGGRTSFPENARTVTVQLFDVDTPALLVDVEAMEHNLRSMAGYFQRLEERGRRCRLRPHIKSHKSSILAHKQLGAGYCLGITCAKLSEADAMARAGIHDVLIANQIVGGYKITRLVGLARRAKVTVVVDQADNVVDLSEAAAAANVTVGVLVEVNVGLNRCGVEPGRAALELAEQIDRAPGLLFRGLQGYEGHLVNVAPREEREARVVHDLGQLVETRRLVEASGLEVEMVDCGSTSTYSISAELEEIDEIQAGSYLLMDATYEKLAPEFRCAQSVLATVVSRPTPHRIVVDAGMKTIAVDHGLPRVKGLERIREIKLHEEHGLLETEEPSSVRVGDKLELVSGHVCTTVNLHDRYYAMSNGRVEAVWPIDARGSQ
jgi:D-serine deaminase-like pyridoxal phosphate-dependent protein